MQRLFSFLFVALTWVSSASAAMTGFTIELHTTSEYGTTYRLYATFDDPGDWVQAVYGLTGAEGNIPMSILAEGTASIYQTANEFDLNPNYGHFVSPSLFAAVPDLVYDSWLTIGVEDENGSAGPLGAGMSEALVTFNQGIGFADCGGAWFVASPSGSAPEWQAGDDLKVLLAQITMTDDAGGNTGHFSTQLNVQWRTATGVTSYYLGDSMSSSDWVVSPSGCTDPNASNYDATAVTDDGSCVLPGCTISIACNYDPNATIDDGSCYFYCPGCTDNEACNYDDGAIQEDGSCVYAIDLWGVSHLDCSGSCMNDADGDGVCDEDEVSGCVTSSACNYSPLATDDDGSCITPVGCEICEGEAGNWFLLSGDADGDGICDDDEVPGCMDSTACNFDSEATDDNGSCVNALDLCGLGYVDCGCNCLNDLDSDGVCDEVEVVGCQTANACNYNPDATDFGPCEFDSCAGCTYPYACNYDPEAISYDGSCEFGTCPGCTDSTACNFNPTVTESDDSCLYFDDCGVCGGGGSQEHYDCDGNCLYDVDGDGVCDPFDYPIYDADMSGVLGTNDLLLLLSSFGSAPTNQHTESVYAFGSIVDWVDLVGLLSQWGFPSDSELFDSWCIPDSIVADPSCSLSQDLFEGLSFDLVSVNEPEIGFKTYRVYADFVEGSGVQLQGVFGSEELPMIVQTSGQFFQHVFGGGLDYEINPAFEDFFPDLSVDSWFDISPLGVEALHSVGISQELDAFESGGSFDLSSAVGGGIFGTSIETIPEDGRFLLGQFTTQGDLDFTTNILFRDSLLGPNFIQAAFLHIDPAAIGCMDELACNYNSIASTDDGGCVYPDTNACETCSGETDGTGQVLTNDSDGDGICDADEVPGCTDPTACNYNANATDEGGSCIYPTGCETCTGETDGSGQVFANDADGDGVCDADEVPGCLDSTACNFNANATDDSSSCIYPAGCETCTGEEDGTGQVFANDADGDGVCDGDEVPGCMDLTACNYNANATDDSSSCNYPTGCETCSGETDGTGQVLTNDADGDGICDADEVPGCVIPEACNYDVSATDNNGSCNYPSGCQTCSGESDGTGTAIDNDADGDGVCDVDEITGCTDPTACNYDDTSTTDTDNELCVYPTGCETCSGEQDGTGIVVNNDADGDGICDADELPGCTDLTACNYNVNATDESGSCNYPVGCNTCSGETDGTGQMLTNDADGDGVCDGDEVPGCMDLTACNYNMLATDPAECSFSEEYYDCDGNCLADADWDGVCDELEVPGCQDENACNFDPSSTEDDGSCVNVEELENAAYALGESAGYNELWNQIISGNFCGPGLVWDAELEMCMQIGCQEDLTGDGEVGVGDLMQFLSMFGVNCEE